MARNASMVNYSVRIDGELKRNAEAIYGELGMTLSAAINAFLRKSVREGGFPFEMRLDGEHRASVLTLAELDALDEDAAAGKPRLAAVR